MYSNKIKELIKRASRKSIGAIPVGLKVSFGGAKVFVEAQYEISGNVVIYLIGEGKKTIAKIDGSVNSKNLAVDKLLKYAESDGGNGNIKDVLKFVSQLDKEVNVANGKGKFAVLRHVSKKKIELNKMAVKKKVPTKAVKAAKVKVVKAVKAVKVAKAKVVRAKKTYVKLVQTGSSNKRSDAKRIALKPGKRLSASNRTYYEYRANRTDINPRKKGDSL